MSAGSGPRSKKATPQPALHGVGGKLLRGARVFVTPPMVPMSCEGAVGEDVVRVLGNLRDVDWPFSPHTFSYFIVVIDLRLLPIYRPVLFGLALGRLSALRRFRQKPNDSGQRSESVALDSATSAWTIHFFAAVVAM